MIPINFLQKLTLMDFPKVVACEVFLAGCNFNCTFCHNPSAVKGAKANVSEEEFFDFLNKRKKKIEGVVISGGEPTIHPDLFDFIKKIKDLGFKVKLDTNGTNPEVLKKLFHHNLLDYVAMDVKTTWKKYKDVTGAKRMTPKIRKSIKLIINSGIPYEFRTTVFPQLTLKDLKEMIKYIDGANVYYLQQYKDEITLNSQKHLKIHSGKTLNNFKKELKKLTDTSIKLRIN